MYRVAICEDEAVFAESQETLCRRILDKLKMEYTVSVYRSSEDFLAAFCDEGKRYELLLLDIVMDGTNGMELAKTIREADGDAAIIFITSSGDFALQGYDVKALHYLMKPVDEAVLERLIAEDRQRRLHRREFVFLSGAGQVRVPLEEIVCFETKGRRVEVTLLDRTVFYPGKLSELLLEVGLDKIVRCHQAFAVNIANVRELTAQDAIAVNGKRVPVSRTYAKDVQKAFVRQLQGKG